MSRQHVLQLPALRLVPADGMVAGCPCSLALHAQHHPALPAAHLRPRRYCTPLLGGLLQHGLRRCVSAYLIGGARLAAKAWPLLDAWLRRVLPGGNRKVDGLQRWAARVWWRQAPPVSWRRVPAPYDPRM